jgi:hypothetical protein
MVDGRGIQDFYIESRITGNSNKPNNLKSKITNKISDLRIYHQNIRGLRNKADELLSQWVSQSPHILCITEHHLNQVLIIITLVHTIVGKL